MSAEVRHAVVRERPGGRGVLVLMHGRGADERDLLPLAEALDPDGRWSWALPRAPLPLGPGFAWYDVQRVGEPAPETFAAGLAGARSWLERLGARLGMGAERTVLAGFSQGAVMACALALGGWARPAGVLALSGYIPRGPGFQPDPDRARGLPVFVQHGTYDPVIPVGFGREAERWLRAAGARVEYHEFPGGHHVDPRGLALARDWLAGLLPDAGAGREG